MRTHFLLIYFSFGTVFPHGARVFPNFLCARMQAWIGTLGRGVTNVTLNSSYSNRDNDQYKDELGATLANLCRIVPGGMLVFFST